MREGPPFLCFLFPKQKRSKNAAFLCSVFSLVSRCHRAGWRHFPLQIWRKKERKSKWGREPLTWNEAQRGTPRLGAILGRLQRALARKSCSSETTSETEIVCACVSFGTNVRAFMLEIQKSLLGMRVGLCRQQLS